MCYHPEKYGYRFIVFHLYFYFTSYSVFSISVNTLACSIHSFFESVGSQGRDFAIIVNARNRFTTFFNTMHRVFFLILH